MSTNRQCSGNDIALLDFALTAVFFTSLYWLSKVDCDNLDYELFSHR